MELKAGVVPMSPYSWVTAYLSIEKIGVLLAYAVAGVPQIPGTMSIMRMGQKCIINKVVDNQNGPEISIFTKLWNIF